MKININERLKKSANYDPTKETINKSLAQLCKDVEDKKLIMPIFQRGLSWTTQKKVELYNFQLNGLAPVAPISINRIGLESLEMPHIEVLTRSPVPEPSLQSHSVMDGQQRITTNFQAYINDESIRGVVLDIGRGYFRNIEEEIKRNQIPVGILYNKDPEVYNAYLEKKKLTNDPSILSLLSQIRTKFLNYFYIINFAENLTGEEQIEWFDVLNLAGSKVTELQMILTRFQMKGLDFYKEYSNEFLARLEEEGFGYLFIQKDTEVSIPAAALNPALEKLYDKVHTSNYSPIPSDIKDRVISNMEPIELRKCFNWTLKGLDNTLSFLKLNKLVPDRIDFITYLTGYFVLNGNDEIPFNKTESLADWYKQTDFTNKTNSERRQMFNELLSI